MHSTVDDPQKVLEVVTRAPARIGYGSPREFTLEARLNGREVTFDACELAHVTVARTHFPTQSGSGARAAQPITISARHRPSLEGLELVDVDTEPNRRVR